MSRQYSDEEILAVVNQVDEEQFYAGIDIYRRILSVPNISMEKLGYFGIVTGSDTLQKRFHDAFDSIYRKQDLACGGHIGVFMFRDVFARVSPPHVFGTVMIKPFEHVDLSPIQLTIIRSDATQRAVYLDQFCDIMDIHEGVHELNNPFAGMEPVTRFMERARLHLHAAAAILTGGYDYRGAVQSALLAVELGLKAALLAKHVPEHKLKNRPYGHDLNSIVQEIETLRPQSDTARIQRVIGNYPTGHVRNRYSDAHPTRTEVGHMVMGAQFIVAEMVRLLSDRNTRAAFDQTWSRSYPA